MRPPTWREACAEAFWRYLDGLAHAARRVRLIPRPWLRWVCDHYDGTLG